MSKKINIIVLLFLLIIVFSSCFNQKKHFKIIRIPVKEDRSKNFKKNGVYISNQEKGSALFFFENGFTKWSGWTNNFIEDKVNNFKDIEEFNNNFQKEYWGHYAIKNDTIIIQEFNHNNEEIYKRSISERHGLIINDSTIVILSWDSYWGNYQLPQDPMKYIFYPTNSKPDSTKAWFNNKRWYKKNLHESRK